MKKQKFYSISQVCKHLRIKPYVLRYWEKEFKISFKRNSAGRRIVSAEQLQKLELIHHLLYREKMTVKGTKKKLTAMGTKVDELPDKKDRYQVILWIKKQLIAIRSNLEDL